MDSAGKVSVTGANADNAFKSTPGGTITEIIDSTGDGNGLNRPGPEGIAVDSAGRGGIHALDVNAAGRRFLTGGVNPADSIVGGKGARRRRACAHSL